MLGGRWVVLAALFLGSATGLVFGQAADTAEKGASPAPRAPGELTEGSSDRLLDIRLGDFRIQPSFTLSETYDTNIFLDPNHAEEDWFTTLNPGVTLRYDPSKKFSGTLGYNARLNRYVDHKEASNTEQTAFLSLKHKLGTFYWRLVDNFDRTQDPINVNFTNLIAFDQHRGTLTLGLDFKTYAFELEGLAGSVRSPEPVVAFFENNTASVTGRGIMRLWKGVNGIAEFTSGRTNFLQGIKDDQHFQQGRIGLVGKLGEDWTLNAKAGYHVREYENDSGTQTFDDDFQGLVWNAALRWTPSKEDTFQLSVLRQPQESSFSNYFITNTYGLNYTRRFGEDLTVSPSFQYERIIESTHETGQFRKKRLTAGVKGTYHLTRWLDLEAGYQYREKQTVDDLGEYIDSLTWVGLSGRF